MALQIGSFLTKEALTRATEGVEGARYVGARVAGVTSTTVQGILVSLKEALDSKAASNHTHAQLHAREHGLLSADHPDADGSVAPQNGNVVSFSSSSGKYAPSPVPAHATRHREGGADALTPADIGAYAQSAADQAVPQNLATNGIPASTTAKNLPAKLYWTMIVNANAGYPAAGLLVTTCFTTLRGYDDTTNGVAGHTKQTLYRFNSTEIQIRTGIFTSGSAESWSAWRIY